MNSEQLTSNAKRVIKDVIASNGVDKVLKLLTSSNKWYYLPGNSRYFDSICVIDIEYHKTLYGYSGNGCCISSWQKEEIFFKVVETRAQVNNVYELPEEFVNSILEMIAFA